MGDVRSFGGPVEPERFIPDRPPALELPVRLVVDHASLAQLGKAIADVVAAAVQDGVEMGLSETLADQEIRDEMRAVAGGAAAVAVPH